MRNYLKLQGWYTDEEEQELRDLSRKQVLEALVAAEKIAPLSPDECAACPGVAFACARFICARFARIEG